MRGFPRRSSVEEVLASIRQHVHRPDPEAAFEEVEAAEAAGRVLAREVRALFDVPGFDRAAMDGHAVRGEDTFGASPYNPVPLKVIGEARPGAPHRGTLGAGEAVRIMTGAPLPEGADAVLPAEASEEEGATLEALEAVPPRRHVSTRGEDLRAGDLLLWRGRLLRAQDAGAAASAGHARLAVFRRPLVALLVTGDELVPPGLEPDPDSGTVVDSNSVVLTALVRRDGGEPLAAERVRDGEAPVREAMRRASARADLVLVSGASSVGAEDHAPRVLDAEGLLLRHGVAMRPSGPAGFGLLGGRPVFLLPGNPVSCLCAYDFFAGPALRRLAGLPETWPYPARRLPAGRKIVSVTGRLDYVRVRVEEGAAVPLATSGASILSSTVRADGFVVVPENLEGYGAGEEVIVHLYEPGRGEGP